MTKLKNGVDPGMLMIDVYFGVLPTILYSRVRSTSSVLIPTLQPTSS
jgi:hypothetical protein